MSTRPGSRQSFLLCLSVTLLCGSHWQEQNLIRMNLLRLRFQMLVKKCKDWTGNKYLFHVIECLLLKLSPNPMIILHKPWSDLVTHLLNLGQTHSSGWLFQGITIRLQHSWAQAHFGLQSPYPDLAKFHWRKNTCLWENFHFLLWVRPSACGDPLQDVHHALPCIRTSGSTLPIAPMIQTCEVFGYGCHPERQFVETKNDWGGDDLQLVSGVFPYTYFRLDGLSQYRCAPAIHFWDNHHSSEPVCLFTDSWDHT